MMFDEHRARMMAEQRQREAEMAQREHQRKLRDEGHAQVPGEQEEKNKSSTAKKRGRWWRFWIGN